MAIRTTSSGNADADKVYQHLVALTERAPVHLRDEIRRGHMTSSMTYRRLEQQLKLEPYEVLRALEHLHARCFIDVTWCGHGVDYFFRPSLESRVA